MAQGVSWYRPRPRAAPQPAHRAGDYIVGNTLALLSGLATAYFVLLRGSHIMTVTLRTGDFLAYYGGARLVATGHGRHLYDAHAMEMLQRVLLYPMVNPAGTVLPYLYHPYWAVAQAPLAFLPFEWAFLAFTAINCLMLSAILFALERYTGISGRPAFVMRGLALVSLPVLQSLFNAQASIVITGCLVACFFAARSGRAGLAGVALACACIKPQYVLPFLLVFAVRRQWRTVAACAATSAVLLLVPMAVAGWSIDGSFVHSLLHAASYGNKYGFFSDRNASIIVFVTPFLSSPMSLIVTGMLSLAALGCLALCAARSETVDLPIALAVVVAVLITPHVLIHDLCVLLLPVAVLIQQRRAAGKVFYWSLGIGYVVLPLGYAFSSFSVIKFLPLCVAVLGAALAWPGGAAAPEIGASSPPPRTFEATVTEAG